MNVSIVSREVLSICSVTISPVPTLLTSTSPASCISFASNISPVCGLNAIIISLTVPPGETFGENQPFLFTGSP